MFWMLGTVNTILPHPKELTGNSRSDAARLTATYENGGRGHRQTGNTVVGANGNGCPVSVLKNAVQVNCVGVALVLGRQGLGQHKLGATGC